MKHKTFKEFLIIKYNGKNINENKIWGTDQKHHERLLVATVKELI